jgi:hypothetical protein
MPQVFASARRRLRRAVAQEWHDENQRERARHREPGNEIHLVPQLLAQRLHRKPLHSNDNSRIKLQAETINFAY